MRYKPHSTTYQEPSSTNNAFNGHREIDCHVESYPFKTLQRAPWRWHSASPWLRFYIRMRQTTRGVATRGDERADGLGRRRREWLQSDAVSCQVRHLRASTRTRHKVLTDRTLGASDKLPGISWKGDPQVRKDFGGWTSSPRELWSARRRSLPNTTGTCRFRNSSRASATTSMNSNATEFPG